MNIRKADIAYAVCVRTATHWREIRADHARMRVSAEQASWSLNGSGHALWRFEDGIPVAIEYIRSAKPNEYAVTRPATPEDQEPFFFDPRWFEKGIEAQARSSAWAQEQYSKLTVRDEIGPDGDWAKREAMAKAKP